MSDVDTILNYCINWNSQPFFHIFINSIGVMGGVFFCSTVSFKIGLSLLRSILDI